MTKLLSQLLVQTIVMGIDKILDGLLFGIGVCLAAKAFGLL